VHVFVYEDIACSGVFLPSFLFFRQIAFDLVLVKLKELMCLKMQTQLCCKKSSPTAVTASMNFHRHFRRLHSITVIRDRTRQFPLPDRTGHLMNCNFLALSLYKDVQCESKKSLPCGLRFSEIF